MPLSRALISLRWMNSIEPTSTPRVGWAATSSRDSRVNSRAMMTFCWLPPDSVAAGGAHRARPNVELLRQPLREAHDRLAHHLNAARERRPLVACAAPGCRRPDSSAPARASGGPPGCAPRHSPPAGADWRASRRAGRARSCPPTGVAQAGQRFDQLRLAVALHARDAQDLARPHLQRQPVDRRQPAIGQHPQVAHPQHRRRQACAGDLSTRSSTGRPTIMAASDSPDASRGRTEPTTLPCRRTVTRSATSNTSCSLCVMKMMPGAASRSACA